MFVSKTVSDDLTSPLFITFRCMENNSSVLSEIKKENHAVQIATWNVVD